MPNEILSASPELLTNQTSLTAIKQEWMILKRKTQYSRKVYQTIDLGDPRGGRYLQMIDSDTASS